MGAYLSTPITDKKSQDFQENKKYDCGLSGMQGWRISMEDAYNCEPQIDEDTGFFAVYDGHGGGEVAMYCSHHFVDILKSMDAYKAGDMSLALSETYMEIDRKLKEPRVIKELKLLSQMEPGGSPVTEEDIIKMEEQEREDKEEEADETKLLYEEATMSIEALLAKYGRVVNETEQKMKELHDKESSSDSPVEAKTENKECNVKSKESEENKEANEGSDAPHTPQTQDNDGSDETENNKETSEKVSAGGVMKKLRKAFPKSKPAKIEEEDDSEDDDDYDGFESDEAVEGSSEDDDDDDDDSDDDTDECDEDNGESNEEPPAGNMWIGGGGKSEDEGRGLAMEQPGCDSGTTAVVAVLRDIDLYVANAGDSRCVLSRKDGAAFDMSNDHKPEDEVELSRITNAGGHVNVQGRVNGGLNLSRALGDHLYKNNADLPLEEQMITALPDIRHVTLEPGDEFMVIACDGIWNVMSSQEVVDYVRSRIKPPSPTSVDEERKEPKLSEICEELFQKCLAADTTGDGTGCDNMTCIVIRFNSTWVERRHEARRNSSILLPSVDPKSNKQTMNDGEYPDTAKGDFADSDKQLNKKLTQETTAEKRPLEVAKDNECVNGENKSVKRAKVE